MQLKKIQSSIEQYRHYLQSKCCYDRIYWWESQWHFQEHWDMTNTDFATMFDSCFQNSQSKRLWKREAYFPKKRMLEFVALEPDFVKQMFKDLFDESKSVDGRIDRFIYYCDELLQMYKKAYPASVENNHYHTYETCFMYLAMRYPERYTLYDFDVFQGTLQVLGSLKVPLVHDLERFVKVSKTLWTFLTREEDLLDLHRQRLKKEQHYTEASLLMVSEWMQLMVE